MKIFEDIRDYFDGDGEHSEDQHPVAKSAGEEDHSDVDVFRGDDAEAPKNPGDG